MGAHEAKQMILEQEQMLQAEAVQVLLAPKLMEVMEYYLNGCGSSLFNQNQYLYDQYVSTRTSF